MYDYLPIALGSQQAYAHARGYGHVAFQDRISGDRFVDSARGGLEDKWGGGLFWQKIAAIEQVLEQGVFDEASGQTDSCGWVVWMDSDVLITNPRVSLEYLVARYAAGGFHGIDVVLAEDPEHPINAGVFFVRNNAGGRAFVRAVEALYPLYKDSCLPEQSAMAAVAFPAEPWPACVVHRQAGAHPHPKIAVAPQRAFDSFQHPGRPFPPEAQWQPGDFVAHFAGNDPQKRAEAMRLTLRAAGLPEPL